MNKRKKVKTLRRAEAHQMIDDIIANGTPEEMRTLAQHWDVPGHWNETLGLLDWAQPLHEFVDESADMLFDSRSGKNPSDNDKTELTAP